MNKQQIKQRQQMAEFRSPRRNVSIPKSVAKRHAAAVEVAQAVASSVTRAKRAIFELERKLKALKAIDAGNAAGVYELQEQLATWKAAIQQFLSKADVASVNGLESVYGVVDFFTWPDFS